MIRTVYTEYTDEEFRKIISESVHEALKTLQFGEPDRILTTEDLMEEFQISKPTVITYRKSGLIPFFTIGDRIRFSRNDVIESLKKANKTGFLPKSKKLT